MNIVGNKEQFFYRDARLEMTFFERVFVRWAVILFWVGLTALTILFILMRESSLKFFGYFLALFILDRLLNLNRSEKIFNRQFEKQILNNPTLKINLLPYCEVSIRKTIEAAYDKTILQGGNFYLHLLNEFLNDKRFQDVFRRLEIKYEEVEAATHDLLNKNSEKKTKKELIKMISELVTLSYFLRDRNYIKSKDVFAAIFHIQNNEIERLKNYFRFTEKDIALAAVFSEFASQIKRWRVVPEERRAFVKEFKHRRQRIMNRAWTARPTPTLDNFSTDLTNLARLEQVGFLIGHERELKQVINILSRASNNNVLLVGEPSVGIGAIVRHVAYLISKDEVPHELFDKRLVMLSIDELVAGCDPITVTERLKKIISEILIARNIILFIPDIHNLFKTSTQGYLQAAEVLIPMISKSGIQTIGSTTPDILKKELETKKDFISLFEAVRVEEISESEATLFLIYSSLILEKRFKAQITYPAIKNAVNIAHRYFRDKLLPLSADDFLKEVLADVRNLGQKIVTSEDVIRVAQQKINVPLSVASKEEAQKLLNLEEIIHQRLIDQEEAVKEVSKALREYRAGLSRKGGPIATFLFVGPTGVGKTELAKTLARIQFGSEEAMIRFDMSQYQDKKSIFDFIGTPEGDKKGILTEAVRQKPYSLILLDEFEKAHTDLLNIFLSVFDDGRLVDNFGRTIDFTNTIIIATSNAHSNLIKQRIEEGVDIENIATELKKRLTEYFPPELINRFSDIIVFKPLRPEDLLKITSLLLNDLAKNLKEEKGIELVFDESVIKKLVEVGYDPVYGARPLRNAISDNIRSLLANSILQNEFVAGDRVLLVYENEKFEAKKTG
ncbi:MAG: ATP-dependent Clp protease ATP-binding subunit [Patescibacteria group bacterium]|nr:ATP-dependent Clp protease ATP-binding subunit [Patescibacteria group bacterium]